MASESILGRAKIPISADLSQLDKDLTAARSKTHGALDKLAKSLPTGKLQSVVGGMSSAVSALGAGASAAAAAAVAATAAIAAGAAAAGVALTKLALDAAPVEGIQEAFRGLAESSGQSMDELLGALQRGSAGMISQRDLMMTYNSAAQLVSTTFANQLPEAMGYLSKIAAATGQDMGYMLDSLVKGVGRLSPMILDNLQIQVSLAEATAKASSMFGVEADALSKSQTQAGMMNVVLEKLRSNTAAMPQVTGTTAQSLASLSVKVQDVKDKIGMAFLPILEKLLGQFNELIEEYLPGLMSALESTRGKIDIWARETIPKLFGWIRSKLIPAIADLVTWIKNELVPWVRDKLIPAFKDIADWIKENVVPAIKDFAKWIETDLVPAIEKLWKWIDNNVIPAVKDLATWFKDTYEKIRAGLETWKEIPRLWNEMWTRMKIKWIEFWRSLMENVNVFGVFDSAIAKLDRALDDYKRTLDHLNDSVETHNIRVIATGKTYSNWDDALKDLKRHTEEWEHGLGGLQTALQKTDSSLPSWFRPGSPTPLELGLRGITKEMQRLAQMQVPALEVGLQRLGNATYPPSQIINHNFNQTIVGGGQPSADIIYGTQVARALLGAR